LQRLDIIKRGLSKYMAKMGEVYGKTMNNPDIAIKVMEALNPNEDVEAFFSVRQLFSVEEIAYLKKLFPKAHEVTVVEMRDYIEHFNYGMMARSPLIMKEWKVQKDGGMLKGMKNWVFVATVDYNLLLIEEKVDWVKPDKVMKMGHVQVVVNESDRRDSAFVDLVEKVPGLIMDSKNKMMLKFDNSDAAEEFVHFVNNYQAMKENHG